MTPDTKARLKRTALLCLMALAAGAGIGFWQLQGENSGKNGGAPMAVAGADIGGPFTLVDQQGQTVTEKSYAGGYKLIYFGFTYCPAICPTELQKISAVMLNLEDEDSALAERVQPIFITVDPERDTVEVMREYVTLFHPRLAGLTGSQEQIDAVKKAYRIYSAKVETENSTDYTVDHSSFIYLMSPEDQVLGIYRAADDADMVTKDVLKFLRAS